MNYHVYFIDRFGQPYVKVCMEDREKAIAMMRRYAGKKDVVYEHEFRVSDGLVLIFREDCILSDRV